MFEEGFTITQLVEITDTTALDIQPVIEIYCWYPSDISHEIPISTAVGRFLH